MEEFLSSPLIRSLELEDLRILRINDPAGWNGSPVFDTLSSRETGQTREVSVEARGNLNGQAFTLSGKFPDLSLTPGAVRNDAMSLKLAVKGIESGLDGRLTQDVGGLTLTARLDVRSPSLSDMQEMLKLARAVEGAGTLGMALDGALAKLAINSAKLRIESADGREYQTDGKVADRWALDGVRLSFIARLVPPPQRRASRVSNWPQTRS